ncbi:MAG: hypothetical protein QNJ16_04840 [Rhodobacter sp.]|nr:hypothetical protein [Rhodobacter sp.]
MYDWETNGLSPDQAHWSKWTARPRKTIKTNNYLSALVFAMSAFVVAANYGSLV